MDEQREKRVDLNSELGMSRRDLLRRGAIVGGTLLWVAPAIQTMAPKAFAQVPGASGGCEVCYCHWFNQRNVDKGQKCYGPGPNLPFNSDATCLAYCNDSNNPDLPKTADTLKTQHQWCAGTKCQCATDGASAGTSCS